MTYLMHYIRCITFLLLLVSASPGCNCADEGVGSMQATTTSKGGDRHREGDEGDRDLEVDELVGRGTPTPFGLALDVDLDEATLLYPTLIAFGAPSKDLAEQLPETLQGRVRDRLIHGVQEGLDAAWVGAIGRYGELWVMIQDAGWEPTTLNPLYEGWRSENQDPLSDGRPVSDIQPPEGEGVFSEAEGGGVFLQAPVSKAGAHRIVVHAHGPEGTDEGLLRGILEAIPAAPLLKLERASLGRTGPYPLSSRLPSTTVLAPLADPSALALALPTVVPDGWTQVGEGWGWRREASRNILTGAWRVFHTPHGVLVASAQDLGDPERPVVLNWKAGESAGGTADEIRRSVQKSKKTRCSDFFASCKWAKLVEGRVVLSAFGPMGDGKEATTEVAQAFDLAAAAAAVKGR
jgi:hypothetical protein